MSIDFNNVNKHKTFISFRYPEANKYKDELVRLSEKYELFDDYSIGKGDVDRKETDNDEEIRKEIVRDWIAGATVTILLVTPNMSESKFIDWEIQATMSDNENNSKMGLLCVYLPTATKIKSTNSTTNNVVKTIVGGNNWVNVDKTKVEQEYADLPKRVRKNLIRDKVKIDVIGWNQIFDSDEELGAYRLKVLIDEAFKVRNFNEYDISDKLQKTHK